MRRTLWICAWLAAGCFRSYSDVDGTGEDPTVVLDFEPSGTPPIDIVVLVDNSGSMAEEQAVLALRFADALAELLDPPLDPYTGRPTHPPVEDLNLAVISPDMGTAGHELWTCSRPFGGDQGCFLHEPRLPGCAAAYPAFLSRNPSNADSYPVSRLAADFACVATLGTSGCGFEQPLAAMQAALTPPNSGSSGCNAGFLRPDSILVLLFVTDEDDCSVRPEHPEMFDQDRTDLGHPNLRCFLWPEFVTDVETFVAAFRGLRSDPGRLVLNLIIGVPPDAPQCIGPGDTLDACLSAPEMVEMIDPVVPTQLLPSCSTEMGLAFPPRRLVRLAQAFGRQAHVDSICGRDWRDTLVAGVVDRLGEVVPDSEACLRRALDREPGSCRVDCAMVETLSDDRACAEDPDCPAYGCPPLMETQIHDPPACRNPRTGVACQPLKRDLGTTAGADGLPRRRCLVRQAERPLAGGSCGAPTTTGWFYRAAGESELGCPAASFTVGSETCVEPGSRVWIRCR